MLKKSRSAIFTISICLGLSGLLAFECALSGGFQLWEQDASGIGDNHAGSGAEALNAGTEFYNPAGMTHLPHFVMSGGLAYIPLTLDYSGTVGGAVTEGGVFTTAQSSTDNYVPNFHVVYPVNSNIALGFGITVPFGLSTEYAEDNPIAAAATKTDLQTVNVNPSVAFLLSRYVSIGLGFDAVRGSATYNSMDTTNIPATRFTNDLSGWAYGWNAGVLFYVTPHTRIGASYRSSLELDGTGTSFDEASQLTSDDLTATIKLPSAFNFSFYSDVSKRVSVLFTAYYTRWSAFDDLVLQNVAALGDNITVGIHENYQNTVALAAGIHVKLSEKVMLKLGVGHDETPTQDNLRDVRLPDSNRYSVAAGLRWQLGKAVLLDFGWMHFFADEAKVNNTQSTLPSSPISELLAILGETVGASRASVNVVGIQLSWTPAGFS